MPLPNPFVQVGIGGSASITGGTIDGAVIGGTTPAAGTFTTIGSLAGVMLWGAHLSNSGAPTSGGSSGFAQGDTFTIAGGTFTTAATGAVDTVSSGVITAYHITNAGIYTTPPTQPCGISATSGSGIGAPTFTLTFGPLAAGIPFPSSGGGVSTDTVIGALAGLGRKYTGIGNAIFGLSAGGGGSNTGDGLGGGTGLATGEGTYIGNLAGAQVTTGTFHTFVGLNAGGHEVAGTKSTLVGTDAGKWLYNSNGVTAVGWDTATYLQNASRTVAIGSDSVRGNIVATSVTGAANNGSGLVRLAVTSTSDILTGDTVVVTGVTGTTEANGYWPNVTVVDSTHIDLTTSAFVHTFVSGGGINAFSATALDNVTSVGYFNLSGTALRSVGALSVFGSANLTALTTGKQIVTVGTTAGTGTTTGIQHVFVGDNSGNTNTVGSGHVIIGFNADITQNNVNNSVLIGSAGGGGQNGARGGGNSVIIGGRAGGTSLTGGNNTFIGYQIGSITATTAGNCLLIGTSNTIDTPASNTTNYMGLGTSNGVVWSATGCGTPSTSITTVAGASVLTGAVTIGASGAPTLTSGSGAPGSTQPNGSLYLRTDGSVSTRLYISEGGGTWAAVASA